MAALERAEIETSACTSSVRVSTAFVHESSYRDTTDGDCSARSRSVCESSYQGSGMRVQSTRPQRSRGSRDCWTIVWASRKVPLGNMKAACATTVIGDCNVREFSSELYETSDRGGSIGKSSVSDRSILETNV